MIGLVVVSMMWGSTATFIKIALTGASPLYVTAARVVTSSLVLLPILWWSRRRSPAGFRLTGADLRHLAVLSAALVLGPYALASWGQQYATASLASVLNATIPLWTVVFAALYDHRAPTARQGVGIVAGLLGVAVLVGLHPGELSAGVLPGVAALCLASAARGFGYLYLHRHLAHLPPLQIAALTQAMAAAVLLPALADTAAQQLRPAVLGALAGLGVIATAGAQLLNYHNIARLGPTTASLSTYLIAIFGVAVAIAALGEPLTARTVAGTAVVLGSVALAFRRDGAAPAPAAEPPAGGAVTAAATGAGRVAAHR